MNRIPLSRIAIAVKCIAIVMSVFVLLPIASPTVPYKLWRTGEQPVSALQLSLITYDAARGVEATPPEIVPYSTPVPNPTQTNRKSQSASTITANPRVPWP